MNINQVCSQRKVKTGRFYWNKIFIFAKNYPTLHMPTTNEQESLQLFSSTYQKYYRRCVLYAKAYTFDSSVAEDLATDSMITFWQCLKEQRQIEEVLPFLFSIVRNKVLHYLRHEQVKLQVHQSLETDEARELQLRISTLEACNPQDLYSSEIKKIINHTLEQMDAKTRKIFIYSRFEGKSNKEIAESMNISVKTVDYHISKALQALRVHLTDYLHILILLF